MMALLFKWSKKCYGSDGKDVSREIISLGNPALPCKRRGKKTLIKILNLVVQLFEAMNL